MCQVSYHVINLKKSRLEKELQLDGGGEKVEGNGMKEE